MTNKTDIYQCLDTLWIVIHGYRETHIPEGVDPSYDEEWKEIVDAMKTIYKQLGLKW